MEKTVVVVNSPISNPDDRTVISFGFKGTLRGLTGLAIDATREVALPELLAHLQSMWDREQQSPRLDAHEHKATA